MDDTQPAGGSVEDTGPPSVATAAQARVLVAYATRHGSTKEVAEAIAEELRAAGAAAEARSVSEAADPAAYDAVVVGGPMIMGWHKDAAKFVKRNAAVLAGRPTALFVTAASLTETGTDIIGGVPVFKDPWLVKEPRQAGRLSRKERYARPEHYLGDILEQAAAVKPVAAAFFGGSLDLTTMNFLEKLFVMLVVGAAPGDSRNWEAIRGWARDVAPRLTEQ
jgi:menaquinone-dependent protoporphyrinogen oxidase